MNIFAGAAKAPRFALRLDTKVFSFMPSSMISMMSKLPPVKRIMATAMESLGMPVDAAMFFNRDGDELKNFRLVGYKNAEQFVQHIQRSAIK